VIKGHISFSSEALSDIAQIGATLLVAYAVEMAWFVKESRVRGRKRENWVGSPRSARVRVGCGELTRL